MHKISEDQSKKMQAIPELGMGFQLVQASGPGHDKYYLLISSLILVDLEELHDPETLWRLVSEPEDALLDALTEFDRHIEICEIKEVFLRAASMPVGGSRLVESAGALHGSPPFAASTQGSTTFVRYTAFARDPRVSPTGGVAPGTYFTTIADSHEVPSGLAAVGRYALPIPRPAIYRKDLVVPANTSFLFGSVAPAFGRSGGGVEIELNQGAAGQSWTVQVLTRM
jgi:hypothetical protein